MYTRIQNAETLLSTGNRAGRRAALEILEAGLQSGDPYDNVLKLLRIGDGKLIVGNAEFEPAGSPRTGDEIFDLARVQRIYVFGAGKGVQRVAKAIEDVLGDRLTGGHVIDKKGHPVILERIGVTLGGHPAPDEDCAKGCEKILAMTRGLTEDDLVFTIAGSGVSSLMTMPAPGLTVEDLSATTYVTQIERGTKTADLGPIRNHLDMMKGGKIARYIHPARMVHILSIQPESYEALMHRNSWLHTLPDYSTFQTAIDNLKREDAWHAVPASVRRHLEEADPEHETVKAEEFEKTSFRIFGVMPHRAGIPQQAMNKARDLGFTPIVLAEQLSGVEASQAGIYMAAIAKTIERTGQPFEPPCALFSNGEVVVTVGDEKGIGGRNQELALSAALEISGSANIVIGSVDTDGTDGPGAQFVDDASDIPCLAGGIVDGETMEAAASTGIDLREEMKRHNTTPALWELRSGIVATPNISLLDLTVAVVLGRHK
jgi:glycerate-2-kinase